MSSEVCLAKSFRLAGRLSETVLGKKKMGLRDFVT